MAQIISWPFRLLWDFSVSRASASARWLMPPLSALVRGAELLWGLDATGRPSAASLLGVSLVAFCPSRRLGSFLLCYFVYCTTPESVPRLTSTAESAE